MKKRFPTFHSDEEAKRFVETADLTECDLSQFLPAGGCGLICFVSDRQFGFPARARRPS